MVTGPELVTKYVKSFTVTVPEEGSAPALSNTLTYGRTYTKDPASGLVSTITHNATLNVGEQPYAASQIVKPPFFGPVVMRVLWFHDCAFWQDCMGACGTERSEAEQAPMQSSANSLGVRFPREVWGRASL